MRRLLRFACGVAVFAALWGVCAVSIGLGMTASPWWLAGIVAVAAATVAAAWFYRPVYRRPRPVPLAGLAVVVLEPTVPMATLVVPDEPEAPRALSGRPAAVPARKLPAGMCVYGDTIPPVPWFPAGER